MTALYLIFAAIVVLGPLVALHEWGHFIVAKKLGVKVLAYSIGFGPAIFSRKGSDGVDYRLSAIPLGGYVKMLDEREGEVAEEEKHLAFNNQAPWKKILIVAAGPVMNFIIAIALFWVLLLPASEQLNTRIGKVIADSPAAVAGLQVGDKITAIDGKQVSTWRDANLALINHMGEDARITLSLERGNKPTAATLSAPNFLAEQDQDPFEQVGFLPFSPKVVPTIGEITKGSSAFHQGMKVGDTIVAIEGKPIDDWQQMSRVVRANPEKLLEFQVLRDGKTLELNIMPQGKKGRTGEQYGQIGVAPQAKNVVIPDAYKQTIDYSFFAAGGEAVRQTYELSALTLGALGKMVRGLIGLDSVSGPITIAKVSGEMMSIGWQSLLSFMALMSVTLAVLNLLPIPVLDGGHLVFYTYEAIVGKPMPEKLQIIGLNIGLVLLLVFMAIAIGNDFRNF